MRVCRNLTFALIAGLMPGLLLAGPVNINTADAETLAAELTGIGPALAAAIVMDRQENGLFANAEALMRVGTPALYPSPTVRSELVAAAQDSGVIAVSASASSRSIARIFSSATQRRQNQHRCRDRTAARRPRRRAVCY